MLKYKVDREECYYLFHDLPWGKAALQTFTEKGVNNPIKTAGGRED